MLISFGQAYASLMAISQANDGGLSEIGDRLLERSLSSLRGGAPRGGQIVKSNDLRSVQSEKITSGKAKNSSERRV